MAIKEIWIYVFREKAACFTGRFSDNEILVIKHLNQQSGDIADIVFNLIKKCVRIREISKNSNCGGLLQSGSFG